MAALQSNRFEVALGGTTLPDVRIVDLPRRSTETFEDDQGRQRWGGTAYENVQLERGVPSNDTQLFDWRKLIEQGKAEHAMKELTVTLLDGNDRAQLRWTFTDAWPKDYDPPRLDSTGGGEVATESVTIVFDEMSRDRP